MQFNATNNMQSQHDQAPAHPTVQMIIQSRPLGMQQNQNVCTLSGPSTIPSPFPGRRPLGHQHITNAKMNGMVSSFNDLSTDQNAMYDTQVADSLANLDTNASTNQRNCIQSRYHFSCGCTYHSLVCQCCSAPSSLALPRPMQIEDTHFSVLCADCTILTLDLELEFSKQEAEDGVGLFYEDEQHALATDPEFRRKGREYQALVARVKNERPIVNGWTKVKEADK